MTMSRPAGPSSCPRCGRQVKDGQKFCGFDGTAIGGNGGAASRLDKSRTSAGSGKVCPACRASYPNYARFCPRDSVKLLAAGAPADPATVAGQTAPQAPSTAAGDPGADTLQGRFTQLTGETIEGKYRLDHLIGEGGMAVVYKATQLNMDRPVVLKLMQWQLLGNDRAIRRFEQEARFTARVQHPNVVSVFDVGLTAGGQPYLVMEFIKGESLRDRLERNGPLPVREAMLVLIQVCRGLQEAHNAGLIHRDLKPENILLQQDRERPDWVKIVDFGIAHLASGYQRLTKTGNLTGTVAYMAPEQLRDTPVDARADIYALGVVLFEVLTGTVPFDADTTEAVLVKQLLEQPPALSGYRPDIGAGSEVEALIMKTLEKDPLNRYQSATELRLHCERILSMVGQRHRG